MKPSGPGLLFIGCFFVCLFVLITDSVSLLVISLLKLSIYSFLKILLGYSCFTMLCYFLLYSS